MSCPKPETVNHPKHYNSNPSGVECIVVVEHMNFNVGNAVKYLWRAGFKTESPLEDLKKAKWYVDREIQRLEKATKGAEADLVRNAGKDEPPTRRPTETYASGDQVSDASGVPELVHLRGEVLALWKGLAHLSETADLPVDTASIGYTDGLKALQSWIENRR